MLVNIHKQGLLVLLSLVIIYSAQAQVWTLQQCVDTAQINNRSLQISRNNIQIGVQKHKEANANLIPKLNALGEYKYYTDQPTQLMPLSTFGGPDGKFKETQFGVPHNINANLQFAMPLYNPQIFGAMRATKIASELSEIQYQKTEEQLFFDVSNLYYNAQILQKQLSFIDSNIANSKKLFENIQLLNEQLMVKATDVIKVKLQLEQLFTQKDRIKSNYEQVMNALKFTIGLSIIDTIKIEDNIQYEEAIEYSNSTSVDVRIAEKQNYLLSSELRTLKNSRIPSLMLYGTYGETGFGYDEKPNDFLKFYPIGFVGAQLTFPLFNGTVTNRKINQKKIEIQNSQLQLNLLTEQNAMLIDNTTRQRIVARKTVENTLAQIKLAQTIYEQTILQQREGTATLSDVLLADNALHEAQQTYLSVVIDYLKADLELKKLTGNISNKN
ncbi:MAG: TolC family protein [Bacteroidia bacterium]|nr:TolC family protein [Bacteroidia bacterium]